MWKKLEVLKERKWGFVQVLVVLLVTSCYLSPSILARQLQEHERLEEYRARNYTWPPSYFTPNTAGWGNLMKRRLDQIARVEEDTPRYNGYISVITSAIVAPNFTRSGWGLTRAPEELVQELRQSLKDGLEKGPRLEGNIEVIGTIGEENQPLFVDQPKLNQKVLKELKPIHEEWSGVPLVGAIAYGLRVYRNQSNLNMHVDKSGTHIISCILHVDHSEDSEPWPIIIEDFQGNTNEVVLESGDMLLYESSKCLHGRPRNFTGSWYSSLFVHYYPVGWDFEERDLESHFAVPPHWNQRLPDREDLDELVIVGTSMREPHCKDDWCALHSKEVTGMGEDVGGLRKWYGPGLDGTIISAGFRYPEKDGTDGKDGQDGGDGGSSEEL